MSAWQSGGCPSRRARRGEHKVGSVVFGHIVNDLFRLGVTQKRAWRHGDIKIVGALAVELASRTVAAVLCDKFALVAEGKQRVAAGIDAEDDAAALSAVAAVGSAVRDVFFTPEGHGSVAAVAGFYIDFYSVNKHMGFLSESLRVVALFADDELYRRSGKAEGVAQAVFDISLI